MAMDVNIEHTWKEKLASEFEKPYFATLVQFVKSAYRRSTIYPAAKHIFHAFDLCPWDKLQVVILGQDPYHGPRQAHGLCFSVPEDIAIPPSLMNIYQELQRDVQKPIPQHGNLTHWARQGVFLLNATLTVEARKPGSHQHIGWERFTDAVIQSISAQKESIVFLLWGSYAQKKQELIDVSKHLVLATSHPSPYSVHRGFAGCSHFSQTNYYLAAHQKHPIEW